MVIASPTSNEFIPCNKMAVAILEMCLKGNGNDCWADSKRQYKSCRKDVMRSHTKDLERIKAEKKARENQEKLNKQKSIDSKKT